MYILPALILAIVIRTFLFQPFNLPSGSMEPTLLLGDYIFVSKYPYGYTRYSFPGSPRWISGRIFAAPPQRGDVVVFRLPKDDSTDYCKRIVGLPGDRIQMIEGLLYINGTPIKRERMDDFVRTDDGVWVFQQDENRMAEIVADGLEDHGAAIAARQAPRA